MKNIMCRLFGNPSASQFVYYNGGAEVCEATPPEAQGENIKPAEELDRTYAQETAFLDEMQSHEGWALRMADTAMNYVPSFVRDLLPQGETFLLGAEWRKELKRNSIRFALLQIATVRYFGAAHPEETEQSKRLLVAPARVRVFGWDKRVEDTLGTDLSAQIEKIPSPIRNAASKGRDVVYEGAAKLTVSVSDHDMVRFLNVEKAIVLGEITFLQSETPNPMRAEKIAKFQQITELLDKLISQAKDSSANVRAQLEEDQQNEDLKQAEGALRTV